MEDKNLEELESILEDDEYLEKLLIDYNNCAKQIKGGLKRTLFFSLIVFGMTVAVFIFAAIMQLAPNLVFMVTPFDFALIIFFSGLSGVLLADIGIIGKPLKELLRIRKLAKSINPIELQNSIKAVKKEIENRKNSNEQVLIENNEEVLDMEDFKELIHPQLTLKK